jgi:hypothetical protein
MGKAVIKTAPVAYGGVVKTGFDVKPVKNGGGVIIKGSELLTSLTYAYNATNTNIHPHILPCNPRFWTATRLSNMSDLYSMYRTRKLTLSYIPDVGTDTSGTFVVGTLWGDAIDQITSIDNMFRQISSSPGGTVAAVKFPVSINIPLTLLPQKRFYLTPRHGVDSIPFSLMWMTNDSGTSNISYGQFYIDYEIEFYSPIIYPEMTHTTSHGHQMVTFNADAVTVDGQTKPYVHDSGATGTTYVGMVSDSNVTGDVTYMSWFPLIGKLYYFVDMYYVDSSQWTSTKRYFGLASAVGGALLTNRDAAAKAIEVWGEVYAAASKWVI